MALSSDKFYEMIKDKIPNLPPNVRTLVIIAEYGEPLRVLYDTYSNINLAEFPDLSEEEISLEKITSPILNLNGVINATD